MTPCGTARSSHGSGGEPGIITMLLLRSLIQLFTGSSVRTLSIVNRYSYTSGGSGSVVADQAFPSCFIWSVTGPLSCTICTETAFASLYPPTRKVIRRSADTSGERTGAAWVVGALEAPVVGCDAADPVTFNGGTTTAETGCG